MTQEEKEWMRKMIESEGFCYIFLDYDDHKHIKDKKFHKRREKFIKAYRKLADYINDGDAA